MASSSSVLHGVTVTILPSSRRGSAFPRPPTVTSRDELMSLGYEGALEHIKKNGQAVREFIHSVVRLYLETNKKQPHPRIEQEHSELMTNQYNLALIGQAFVFRAVGDPHGKLESAAISASLNFTINYSNFTRKMAGTPDGMVISEGVRHIFNSMQQYSNAMRLLNESKRKMQVVWLCARIQAGLDRARAKNGAGGSSSSSDGMAATEGGASNGDIDLLTARSSDPQLDDAITRLEKTAFSKVMFTENLRVVMCDKVSLPEALTSISKFSDKEAVFLSTVYGTISVDSPLIGVDSTKVLDRFFDDAFFQKTGSELARGVNDSLLLYIKMVEYHMMSALGFGEFSDWCLSVGYTRWSESLGQGMSTFVDFMSVWYEVVCRVLFTGGWITVNEQTLSTGWTVVSRKLIKVNLLGGKDRPIVIGGGAADVSTSKSAIGVTGNSSVDTFISCMKYFLSILKGTIHSFKVRKLTHIAEFASIGGVKFLREEMCLSIKEKRTSIETLPQDLKEMVTKEFGIQGPFMKSRFDDKGYLSAGLGCFYALMYLFQTPTGMNATGNLLLVATSIMKPFMGGLVLFWNAKEKNGLGKFVEFVLVFIGVLHRPGVSRSELEALSAAIRLGSVELESLPHATPELCAAARKGRITVVLNGTSRFVCGYSVLRTWWLDSHAFQSVADCTQFTLVVNELMTDVTYANFLKIETILRRCVEVNLPVFEWAVRESMGEKPLNTAGRRKATEPAVVPMNWEHLGRVVLGGGFRKEFRDDRPFGCRILRDALDASCMHNTYSFLKSVIETCGLHIGKTIRDESFYIKERGCAHSAVLRCCMSIGPFLNSRGVIHRVLGPDQTAPIIPDKPVNIMELFDVSIYNASCDLWLRKRDMANGVPMGLGQIADYVVCLSWIRENLHSDEKVSEAFEAIARGVLPEDLPHISNGLRYWMKGVDMGAALGLVEVVETGRGNSTSEPGGGGGGGARVAPNMVFVSDWASAMFKTASRALQTYIYEWKSGGVVDSRVESRCLLDFLYRIGYEVNSTMRDVDSLISSHIRNTWDKYDTILGHLLTVDTSFGASDGGGGGGGGNDGGSAQKKRKITPSDAPLNLAEVRGKLCDGKFTAQRPNEVYRIWNGKLCSESTVEAALLLASRFSDDSGAVGSGEGRSFLHGDDT
jgi:hypothetical protein